MARSQSKTPPEQGDLLGDFFGQASDFGAHQKFLGYGPSYIERARQHEKGLALKWSAGALAGDHQMMDYAGEAPALRFSANP